VYAVVETGSKQYRVTPGMTIDVELLPAEAGSDVELERVLMIGGEGAEVRIGTPVVEGARVVATVAEHHRGEKVIVFKMRAKKRYRRKKGHRQELTRLTIKEIIA
jgi:large subunit ribosomal protein L21